MSKRLHIISGGNFGRECLAWANAVPEAMRDWTPYAFLDSRESILNGYDVGIPNLGDPETYQPGKDDVFVCAIGDSKHRLELCRKLEARGFQFANVVHPTAAIGPRVSLGKGLVVCPHVVLTCDVAVGDHCLINVAVCVGHDSVLEAGVTLSPHANLAGWSYLEEAVFLGLNAAVAPKVRIGARCTMGAGAVAVKDLPGDCTCVGVPAKPR